MPALIRILALALALSGLATAAVIPPEVAVRDVFAARNLILQKAIDPADPLEREHLMFSFDGFEGFDYEIGYSYDFHNWLNTGIETATGGSVSYQELFPFQDPRRFYRTAPLWSGDTAPPTWPSSAALIADNIGARFVDLDWPGANDDTGVVAYALYLDGDHVATIDPGIRDWAVTNLHPNTVYELDLFALDAGGNAMQLPQTLAVRTRNQQEPYQNAPRGQSIYLSSGEFTLSRTDMAIAARELGFVFTRTYRSDFEKPGPLGYGWTANIFERLRERGGGDVVWLQGIGRSDTFVLQPGGDYLAPAGVFMTLENNGTGFRLIDRNGTVRLFGTSGKIQSITTRNGNTLTYGYTTGQLTSITDDMGRTTNLIYDADDRIEAITDFTGREVRYTYDVQGNLVSARSPLVNGTPNGNDFPGGKIERYEYDTVNPDPDLAHNLTEVIAPNEVADGSLTPSLVLTYGATGPLHDRLLTETRGGRNARGVPAGGTTTYTYNTLAGGTIAQTTVTDPRGNDVQHFFGPTGHLNVKIEVLAGRPNPSTNYTYDADGNLLSVTHPEGNVTTHVYDSANAARRSQGNRLTTTRTPGPRGADQAQLVTTFTYEPVYNQLRSTTDPRGNTWTSRFDYEEGCDFAAIGAKIGLSAADAQTLVQAAGLCSGGLPGDFNEDGVVDQVNGKVLERRHPTVALDPGSNQAALTGSASQEVVELFQYNQFGQLVLHRDAEHNVHQRSYHGENDPDGDGNIDNPAGNPVTGGYLASTTRDALADPLRNSGIDPTPAIITTSFAYNPRGVVTSTFDPRGVETRQVLNQLDQPVQILRAASTGNSVPDPPEPTPLSAFAFITDLYYDANNNVVQRDVEDRGDSSNTGGTITKTYEYDILDRLLHLNEEIDSTTTRTTRHRYDANGNRALTVLPEGNAVSHQYDERNLLIATTTGAQNPPPGAQFIALGLFDPRGGTPSTVTYHYDDNGNRDQVTDAADTDGSAANNGTTGGDLTTLEYDGYDRPVATVDPVGNATRTTYDANSNVLRTERFGADGGPTPLTNTPSNNLLEDTQFHYDELNRLVQTDRALFSSTLPGNGSTEGATSLGKGDLVPGDGALNARYEYDALGRLTFSVQDDGDVARTLYDGIGRALRKTDPAGNRIDYAYDDNNNVIETRETDVSTKAGVADQIFLTTRLYDSLNRPTVVADNVGQTTRFVYDSRDNVIATSDANGPVTGATITRRAFAGGALTVNTINDHGNVIKYTYDGLDRRLSTVRILTASGFGNGTLNPTPDPAQGIGDGLITSTVDYDRNSLINGRGDDFGFRTEFAYDNLNRRVAEHRGVVPGSPGLTTTISFEYDPDHNLVRRTDEIGSSFNFTYDGINRRTAVGVVPGAGVVGATAQQFEYDGLGRLTFSADDNGNAATSAVITSYDYDSLSRVVRETLTPDPASAAAQTSVNWRAENLRAELKYPGGRQVDFTYDALDRIRSVEDSGSAPEIGVFDYIGKGRLLELRYPAIATRHTYLDNPGTVASGYDGVRRPIGVRDLDSTNTVLTGFVHNYDRTANRLTEQKLHNGANSETYAYDSAYRLLDINRPAAGSAPLLHSTWEMGGNNNWVSVDGLSRTHSNHNEIIVYGNPGPVFPTNDDNGNLTNNGTSRTYQWDAFNRLVAVQDGGTQIARYFYDAAGRRVRKENTNSGALNGVTEYLYDGQQVIEERDDSGTTLRQFVYGGGVDKPLRYDDLANGRAYQYHRNTLGSTFALTDLATGNVAERMLYDAYGSVQVQQLGGAPASENPFLFTGRRLDLATGLYYYRARYLDTVMGRFLGRDPLGVWGDPANLGNSYAYCGNNPINRTDPSGMLEIEQTATYGGIHDIHMNQGSSLIAFGAEATTFNASRGSANPFIAYGSEGSGFIAFGSEGGTGNSFIAFGIESGTGSHGIHDIHMHQGLFSHADLQRHLKDGLSNPRGFSEVSGLGAELSLAGNDNEWRTLGLQECTISKSTAGGGQRFFDGSDVGLGGTDVFVPCTPYGFAPLQPAEFAVAGDDPSGRGQASSMITRSTWACGFYGKGNKAAGVVMSGGTTMFRGSR